MQRHNGLSLTTKLVRLVCDLDCLSASRRCSVLSKGLSAGLHTPRVSEQMGHILYELTVNDFDPTEFWHYYRLPRDELMAFLDQNAELVGTYDVEWYSPILIYRIKWNTGVDYDSKW